LFLAHEGVIAKIGRDEMGLSKIFRALYLVGMISVVIPVFNEEENVEALAREIAAAARSAPITEAVFVNDASRDGTLEVLRRLKREFAFIKIIQHEVQSGQSAAMMSGARAANGPLICFLDGDGQNDPADIAALYAVYDARRGEGGRLLVAGQRAKRNDNFLRRFSSRSANAIRAWLLRDRTRDTGCSLKLMRREDYILLPFFNHMHRYIPALMLRSGVALAHVDVGHRHRTRGVSKYGFWDRLAAGIVDLAGVFWLLRRARPEGFAAREID
jgi:dolichol-phosphate mannosyltransferase